MTDRKAKIRKLLATRDSLQSELARADRELIAEGRLYWEDGRVQGISSCRGSSAGGGGMSGHTPGPWRRVDTEDYSEIHSPSHPAPQAIALVGKVQDADLVSAAPDLLSALQHILDGALSLPRFAEGEARAAIAKARGEA